MIAIIDYDMGNLRSVQKALEKTGAEANITRNTDTIAAADGVVLPGVGAFGVCMDHLEEYGLVDPIKNFIDGGKPFLGICLGLQLLFEVSEEFGERKGLGILKGKVKKFDSREMKVPHMGWNSAKINKPAKLLDGVADETYFYFVHSYYVEPAEDVAVTTTPYGIDFVSSVEKDNLFATQFHPEKSQSAGLQILKNFTAKVSSG